MTIAEKFNHDFKNGRRPFQLFDSNGNEIYFENLKGYWCKYEFDSNGNEIYFEDSKGWWCKNEFDSNGNEIYYEDSDGVIHDNRPTSPCKDKIVEIDGKKYQLKEV